MLKKIFYFFSFLFLTNILLGQNVLLSPAKGYFLDSPGNLKYKLMFAPGDSLILEFQPELLQAAGAKLKIGLLPGIYDVAEMDISGSRVATIPTENPLALSTGRYYAVITNSTGDIYEDITADFAANPNSIVFSNEVQFILEAQTAPTALGPTGAIEDPTPIFEWTNVPGVPAYFLIVSSTPFEVVTLPNGEVTVEGANIVWEYITDGTSIQYGDVDPNAPYNIQPPPLIPGTEYNYTILNMYDPADIVFASSVFGGVESFTFNAESTLDPPALIAPAHELAIYGDENITFQWESVENVNSYTIYLFQRITNFAGNDQQIDIPLWNSTTTNTSIQYPARQTLSKGKYIWNVIPNDDEGAGVISETWEFDYILEVGSFRVSAISALDQTQLLNFEFEVQSIEGGVSPPNPYVVTNSSTYTDSLVTGTYEFTGKKTGFYDSTFTVVISESTPFKPVTLVLRPYPAVISGVIHNQDGNPVTEATILFKDVLTNNVTETSSELDGTFSKIMPKATYSILAYKNGYLASDEVFITADQEHIDINNPIVITEDNAFISGKVLNDLGSPVKQTVVKATSGIITQQVSTNASGDYSFELSSGEWTVTAQKNGFISPDPAEYTLSVGDNLQNQNIILIPRANQVTGFVQRITSSGGTTPFGEVTVTATPSSGTPVTATTSSAGEFQLSLRSGTYVITAEKTGYSNDSPINLTLGVAQTISGVGFTMTPNPSSISGLVTTPDGAALSGAVITSSDGASATTLPNGTYTLSVNSGTLTLSVTKDGYVPPSALTVTITPGQNLTGKNFEMTPNAGSITGKVSSLQQPLVNATVTATGEQTYTTQASSNGSYSISLKPGTYSVVATKTGFEPGEAQSITIGPGQISPNNNFNLVEKIATLQGVVQNSSGTPLSNASVTISDNIESTVSTVTNINGNYAMSVEAGKAYTVTISNTGYGEYETTTSVLNSGSTTNINATLTANPSSVSGKVRNNNQQQLAGIEVKIFKTSNGELVNTLTTSGTGDYTSGLTSGGYKITAKKAGYVSDSTTINLALGQNLTNIDFTLSENFAFITGRVTDVSDAGLAGASVDLSGPNGGGNATTDDNGNFTLSGLIGGTYTFEVSLAAHADSTLTNYVLVDGDSKVVDFVLFDLNGKISGTVTDSENRVLTDATVTLTNTATSNEVTTTSDVAGAFEFPGLAFGDYTVSAIKTGYIESSVFNISISQTTPETTVSVNDLVAKNSAITGIIKDDEGLLISEANVSIYSEAGSGGAVSDNEGAFEIASLAPGTYQLVASKQGYAGIDTTFEVQNTVNLAITLKKNKSKVTGTIKDQQGQALGFPVSISLVATDRNFYQVQSDAQGNFEIDEVSDNTEYQLYSAIFKEGYVNDTASVNIPQGTASVTKDLQVTLNLSKVTGNTDIENANVKLLNNTTGKSHTASSGSTGNYEFNFLTAGAYTISATKEGYSFSPATLSATVTFKDTIRDKNFTATSNNGSFTVNAKTDADIAVEGVGVSIVGTSNGIVKTGSTNGLGTITFDGIPSGEYVVRASKDKYTASPVEVTRTLANGAAETVDFTMDRNIVSLEGVVFRDDNGTQVPLPSTTVKIKYNNTGETFTTTSDAQGNYSFTDLAAGNVTFFAVRSGFTSQTRTIDLAGQASYPIKMTASVVTLFGSVLFNGIGVKDVEITATSTSSVTVKTNGAGQYSFSNLPVKTGATDTTIYSVGISSQGLPAYSQIVKLTSAQIGQTFILDNFNLPSGHVNLTISDGANPLPGVTISFTQPGGTSESTVTGNSGIFSTDSNLTRGTYRLSLQKAGYLTPDEQNTRIVLAEDTTKVDTTFIMAYQFNELDSLFANEASEVEITSIGSTANTTAILYYKKQSATEFTQVPMSASSSKFTGLIPPLFTLEEITYYVELTNNSTGIKYSSEEYKIVPLASGILSSLQVKPSIDGLTLREGDSYKLGLTVRDGLNDNLNDEFTGANHEGIVEWDLTKAEGVSIEYPNTDDSTEVTITANTAGQYEIKVITQLKSAVQSKLLRFDITDVPLKKIELSAPASRLSNKSNGIQINYGGVDTLNRPIYLGNEVEWVLTPEFSGGVSETGFFTPIDSNYIGNPIITVIDKITQIESNVSVSVFAEISPNASYTLTDNRGMTLDLPLNSVPTPIEISLDKAQLGPSKKQFTPIGGRKTFTSSAQLYNFQYRAGVALLGDSLTAGALLTLPDEDDLEFFEGSKSIGFYNKISKIWSLINSSKDAGGNMVTNRFAKFGEYAILSENEELGIKHAAVLPSPFSPEVAPLKIGYFLTTAERMAQVTIEVYNIRGELIRTILDSDAQVSGKYGTRTGVKEITWDGLTESGKMARNGRYIIKIRAKDSTGEKSELVQVVLIK